MRRSLQGKLVLSYLIVALITVLVVSALIRLTSGQSLMNLVMNLVDNALRYTPDGGKITLVLTAGNPVRLNVTDSGARIEAEDLPYVFDRFYQAEKARTANSGKMGLDLAICKALILAQGGVISAESPGKGRGTTIVMSFNPAPMNSDFQAVESTAGD